MNPKLEISGGHIIEHMRLRALMRNQQGKYFFWNSPLWNKLREHLISDECDIIDREPDSFILSQRGNGSSIRLLDAGVYPLEFDTVGRPVEPDNFRMTFEIDWGKKKDIGGYNIVLDEFSKTYTIDVPTDLELDFSHEKFNAWIKKQRDNKAAATREKEIKLLKILRAKYPDV